MRRTLVTWPIRRRSTLLASLAVTVLAVGAAPVFGVGPAGAATATKSPKAPKITRQVIGQVEPANAPGRSLILERVVVPPGAEAAVHFHEGTQLVRVEEGAIRYRVTSGAAEITRRDGTTETLSAPDSTRLAAGDVFVEEQSTVHEFRNPTGRRAVLGLAALLRAGAELSTPVGATDPTVQRLEFSVDLTSQSRSLFTLGPGGIDTIGWNRLSGTTIVAGETVGIDFLANVDYERGSGGFFGFFVMTWPDGSTLGVSLEGTATSLAGGADTSFAAALGVPGGTGRFVDRTGSGLFTGHRDAALGGAVALDVALDLRPRPATPAS